jgi:hypothetical protein
MNRKEDLMMPLSGEKTGLKAGLIKNSCVLFFLFYSSLSYCQIPINGFCSLKSFAITKGYKEIISADLNNEKNEELIFYSPTLNRIAILSDMFGDSTKLKEFQVNSEISQLKQLKDKDNSTNYFVAIERKLRKVSLLSISFDSLKEKLEEITFDSYPEKICTSDIDLNGKEEILVSGSGFDGLSVLFRSGKNFGEKKIITGTSFSDAILVDLNDDGYPDILAFNILENSLQFYFNNTNGEFRLRRSIQFPEKINQLLSVDLNKDGFQDIVYSVNNRIEILFGDFQSSYDNKTTIQLDEMPTNIQFGDFNNDKIIDMAIAGYLGKLIIFFGKEGGSYYEGITYLKSSSIGSFTKFKSGNSVSIACLLESGELIFITSLKDFNSDLKIVPSIRAGAVKKFNYANDEIPDISFIDEDDNSLKLFLNNKEGIPSVFYSFPLVETHKEILVDEFFKQRKIFYCYSKGTPLLEVFRYNFNTNKMNRKQLYAPGEILDVAIQRIDSTLVNVFLVYNKESKLYLGKFENRDLSVTYKEYPFIDRNVTLAKIFVDKNPEIYYWKSEGSSLQFKMAEVKPGPNEYTDYFQIPQSDSLSIKLYGADYYNNEYPSLVSIVQSKSDSYSLVLAADKLSINTPLFNLPSKHINKFGRGFFGATSIKGIVNFTLNAEDDAYIYKLVFSEKEKTFLLRKMLEAKNVSDYFFARLDQKNYYLVYSNKNDGSLSITSLKK